MSSNEQLRGSAEGLQLLSAREVPVRAFGIGAEAHDVIAVPIAAGADHAVQHVFEVRRRSSVRDKEESGFAAEAAEGLRLSDDLELLLLVEGIACRRRSHPCAIGITLGQKF